VHHLDIDKVSHYTYKYKFRLGQFFNLLVGIGSVGFSVFLLLWFTVDNTRIILATFCAVFGLVPLLLTINYLTRSLDFQIDIDHDKGLFEITRRGQKKICDIKDVTSVDIREQKEIGLYGLDFDFAKYTFADGKHCIVTNMMTDNYYIPIGLEPKIKKSIFPPIWGRTNV
jgi:hypothetical protein